MTIQQVCKQSGLTVDTIRYYDRFGLSEMEKCAYFNNYSQQTLETLIVIKKLRLASLSLAEIKWLLSMDVDPTDLSQKQIDSVSAIIDNAIQRTQIRAKEIVESQRLLVNMKHILIGAENEIK